MFLCPAGIQKFACARVSARAYMRACVRGCMLHQQIYMTQHRTGVRDTQPCSCDSQVIRSVLVWVLACKIQRKGRREMENNENHVDRDMRHH